MATARLRTLGTLLLLPFLALAACARDHATLDAGARFGLAAVAFATTAEAEFLQIRRDVIDLRARRLGLEPTPSAPGAAGGRSPGPGLALDAGVEADHAEARVASTRALAAFGSLLAAAGGDDPATRQPAARAIEALRLHRALDLSERQAGALADLAGAVSRHTLASRRAAVVRGAMLQTQAPVRDVALAIRADFDPESHRWLANLTNEHAEASLLLERLETSHSSAGHDADLARAGALADDAARASAAALRAAERIHGAADAMLRAHESVIAQFRAGEPPSLDELDALLEEAERLQITWQILRNG